MGIDFIRRTSGKPYTKRWARGLDRTKIPNLFDVRLSEESRTFTATLTNLNGARPGATVIVQSAGPDLVVLDGLKLLARAKCAPRGMHAALAAQHGMAPAFVKRIGIFGDTVEIELK